MHIFFKMFIITFAIMRLSPLRYIMHIIGNIAYNDTDFTGFMAVHYNRFLVYFKL